MSPDASPEQWALRYAEELGWPVLPVHSIRNGACTCGRSDCTSPGKHPRTRHGVKEASTDPKAIRAWWSRWPDANVGIRTGAESGLVVLDVDPRNGGDPALSDLLNRHGELPKTTEAETGGGGRHMLFAHPGDGVTVTRSSLAAGVDIKADGAYIVAPPSVHISGGRYCWKEHHGPGELNPAAMPPWLTELVADQPRSATTMLRVASNGDLILLLRSAWQYVAQAEPAEAGTRNNSAFRLAGHLAAMQTDVGGRLTEAQVLDCLRIWNHRNAPPLENDELQKVVSSAMTNGKPRTPKVVSSTPGKASIPKKPRVAAPGSGVSSMRFEQFRPFPVGALFEPIRRFVISAARSIGCDVCYVAVPLFAALASAIGNTRRIQLKRGWTEPAIVWVAIVGESGTQKTPALTLGTEQVHRRQRDAMRQYAEERVRYFVEKQQYERDLKAWERNATGGEAPHQPEEPQLVRNVVSDSTVEALATVLLHNPRGVLLEREELAGWIASFNQYKGGRGADAQHYLSMHAGKFILVDRKQGSPPTVFVPAACVSVVGGIQPAILDRILGAEHRDSGLLARLLLAMPPRQPKRWSDATIPDAVEAEVRTLFERLYSLETDLNDDGDPTPRSLPLTPAAKEIWVHFVNTHGEEHMDLIGDLSAAWSKLEGYAARLALVLHCARCAAGDSTADPDFVDVESMRAGITLSKWFGLEARRVYGVISESDEQRKRRQLVEWIQRRGGRITVRDMTRGLWEYRGQADAARASLNDLIQSRLGRWTGGSSGGKGGRPSETFELSIDIDETPARAGEIRGFVDVDAHEEDANQSEMTEPTHDVSDGKGPS